MKFISVESQYLQQNLTAIVIRGSIGFYILISPITYDVYRMRYLGVLNGLVTIIDFKDYFIFSF